MWQRDFAWAPPQTGPCSQALLTSTALEEAGDHSVTAVVTASRDAIDRDASGSAGLRRSRAWTNSRNRALRSSMRLEELLLRISWRPGFGVPSKNISQYSLARRALKFADRLERLEAVARRDRCMSPAAHRLVRGLGRRLPHATSQALS